MKFLFLSILFVKFLFLLCFVWVPRGNKSLAGMRPLPARPLWRPPGRRKAKGWVGWDKIPGA